MKKNTMITATIGFLVLSAGVHAAGINNGGFESGLDSWSKQGQVTIQHSIAKKHSNWKVSTVTPYEGNYFAWLATDGMAVGGDYSLISQAFTAVPGDTLSGAYFFGTLDYGTYNDVGTVTLIPTPGAGLTSIQLAKVSVSTVGSYSSMSGWGAYSHTFTQADAGMYSLVYRIEDVGDTLVASYMAADGITLVPEPATLGILAIGHLLLYKRRRCYLSN